MIKQCKNIFVIYYRNRLFILLVMSLVVSGVISKILIYKQSYLMAEEFWDVLFVATLWIVFYLGILIKGQMATHRASLLPGYRKPHVVVLLSIYMLLIILAVAWHKGIRYGFDITRDGFSGGYISCVFVSLLIMYLGYLSIGRVFIYAYMVTAMIALNVSYCISAFETFPALTVIVGALTLIFFFGFMQRLLILKEDHFEYSSLFRWPPKLYFMNQIKSSSNSRILNNDRQNAEYSKLLPYASHSQFIKKAFHWEPLFKSQIKRMIIWTVVLTPFYIGILGAIPEVHDFYKRVYSNFLLLSMTPILVTLSAYYQKMAYWGYDLLRPVERGIYLKERGVVMGIHLLIYWGLMIWVMVLVPNTILQPEIMVSAKFWLYIILTGLTTVLTLAWLTGLSCSNRDYVVICNGIILGGIIMYFVYCSGQFSLKQLVFVNGLTLTAVIVCIQKTFECWMQKEVF